MRQVAWLLILLGAISWLACILPGPEPMHSLALDALGSWRRTATGWENNTTWTKPVASDLPVLHPLVAAALLLAGALGGTMLVGLNSIRVKSHQIRRPDIPVRPEGDRQECLSSGARDRQKFFPFLSSDA